MFEHFFFAAARFCYFYFVTETGSEGRASSTGFGIGAIYCSFESIRLGCAAKVGFWCVAAGRLCVSVIYVAETATAQV